VILIDKKKSGFFSELGGIGSHKNLDELTFISKELGAFIISNFPDHDNYEVKLLFVYEIPKNF